MLKQIICRFCKCSYFSIHLFFISLFVKLASKAQINNNVKPIALAGQDDFSLPESCSVSGWGRTENCTNMSVKLMEVNVTMIEDERCSKQRFYCSEGETGPGEVGIVL